MAVFSFIRSRSFLTVAIVLLLAGLGGAVYGWYLFNKKASDLKIVKPDYTLTATELFSAFDSNEKDATAKFSGKVVEVSGKVAQVEYSPADSTLSITLREDDQMSGVICTLAKGSAADPGVKTGDLIGIRGQCSGMLMDVLLNNCVITSGK